MKTTPHCRWTALLLLVSWPAIAATPAAAPNAGLENLANDVARAVNKTRGDAATPGRTEATKLQGVVWQLKELWQDGNLDGVEQSLKSVIELSPSEGIAEQARALLTQATAEKEQRNARFLTTAEEAVKQAIESCAKAKTPGDLDTISARLQALSTSGPRSRDARMQRTMEQVRGTARFLKKWQEYLAASEGRDFRAATRILEQVTDDAAANAIVPRSEVLLRIQATQAAEATALKDQSPSRLAQSLQTVEDMLRLLDGMKTSRRREMDDEGTSRFLVVLKHLQMGWLAFKGGDSAKAIEVATTTFDRVEGILASDVLEAFARVQRDLLMKALPAELNLGSKYAPVADEKAPDFLMRVIKEASAARDWLLMTRTLDVYGRIAGSSRRGSTDWLGVEKQALNHFVIGQNQEKAGDLEAALRSYEAALRLPSHYLPAEQIGENVSRLKGQLRDRHLPSVEK